MNKWIGQNIRFGSAGYWYTGLIIVLIICGIAFRGRLWIADQFIVYNFITLFAAAKIGGAVFYRKRKYFYYLPLLIISYFFFGPGSLKGLFLISHIIILGCLFLQVRKQGSGIQGHAFFYFSQFGRQGEIKAHRD